MANRTDTWMSGSLVLPSVSIKKQSLILFLLPPPRPGPADLHHARLALANEKDVLTNTEADVLGTGGRDLLFHRRFRSPRSSPLPGRGG